MSAVEPSHTPPVPRCATAGLPSSAAPEPRLWLAPVLLVLPVLIAYLPAVFGGFVWDDIAHIEQNPMLTSPDALRRIWCTLEFQQYLPLQLTSYWAELKLFGPNPVPLHIVNILLHALNGVLIWRVLKRLGFCAPWLAAAVFLLHPVNVETAAWITERRNLLSAAFYLSAVLCWLRFDDGNGRRWYWATLICYVLALLSKTVACSLPVTLLLLRWMRGRRLGAREVLLMLPFFAVGVPMGLLTSSMERYIIGANGYEWSFSPAQRILIAGHALWFYALKDLWPANLTFIYPRWRLDTADWTQWLWVAAALAVIVGLVPLARRFGRRAAVPLLFFGITLFPALGFNNIYPQRFSFVADHFQYLANLGIIVWAVGTLAWLLQSRGVLRCATAGVSSSAAPTWLRRVAGGVASGLLLVLAVLVWRHAAVFVSDENVWRDVLARNNDAWLAHYNLGVTLYHRGEWEEALRHHEEARRCGPDDVGVLFVCGDTYAQLGRAADARAAFSEALAKSPAFDIVRQAPTRNVPCLGRIVRALSGAPPSFLTIYERHRVQFTVEVLLGLAKLDAAEGDNAAALRRYARALELRPQSVKVYVARGRFHEQAGHLAEALADYRTAAEVGPRSGEGLFWEGNVLRAQGRLQDAAAAWEAALARQPDHVGALANLGAARRLAGRPDEAAALLQRALALQPDHVESLHNLACLALARGDPETAERLYRRVVVQKPRQLTNATQSVWRDARISLGALLARRGQFDEAIALLTQAQQEDRTALDPYVHLASVYVVRKQYTDAAFILRAGLEAAGEDSRAAARLQDQLAWLLATCPDARCRDGAQAVRLAEAAVAAMPGKAQFLDTLAAAQAECGEFAAAAATARKAEEAASAAGQDVLARSVAQRRQLYETGKPYREGGP